MTRRPLRTLRFTTLLCCGVMLVCARPAEAQLGMIEGLFRTVSDLSIYSMVGDFQPDWTSPDMAAVGGGGSVGFGLELLFTASRIQRRTGRAARDTVVHVPVETVVRRENGQVVDSTTTYRIETRRIPAQQETLAEFELAVGYSEAGFHVLAGEPGSTDGWEVRGALRQLPAVTFYSNFSTNTNVSFYVGLRSGIAQLTGLRAFGPDGTVVRGSAQAFQFGVAGGLVFTPPPVQNVSLFLEASSTRQRFAAIEWDGKIAPAVPRDMKFRPFTLSAGLQIQFRDS